MYIEPNTTIRILKNVPLDTTFDHTIFWEGQTAQTNYFISKAKYTLNRQSYQRVQRGYMNVRIQAENLYDCNYIMFQNTAFGSKYFYAFLKSVEYVNDELSKIEFELDVMQTWFFDYTLDKCFVEREHSAQDTLFYNIVPENLELGDEYVCNQMDEYDMNNMSICVLINHVTPTGTAISQTINNIYTPTHIVCAIPATDPTTIDAILNEFQEDDIICIYQYPSFLGDALTTEPVSVSKNITPNYTSLNNYVPRNKKLFSYPYNFLLVSNNSGQTAEYKWEDFVGIATNATFKITGVFVSTPCVLCYPTQYRGIPSAYDDGLVYSNFPQCPWSGDVFKAWWAQNKASFVTSGVTSVLSTLASSGMSGIAATAMSANPALGVASAAVSAGIGTVSTVANSVAKIQDIKNTPSQTHGQTQTDSLNPGMRRVKFTFYNMSIKHNFAKIIDDYFDRYGYATHENKVPNRNVRPHWTFTKTIGCTITGSIPADDAKTICEIYNNGITFWKNANEVGDYNLDNRIDVQEAQEIPSNPEVN